LKSAARDGTALAAPSRATRRLTGVRPFGRLAAPGGKSAKRPAVFEALTRGFREAQNRLSGLTELTPKNVATALSEVRLSLLEADVELGVVKGFLERVEQKAMGQTVQTRVRHGGETHRVGAGEQFVAICHDELVAMMSFEGEPLELSGSGATGVMMVGLQGSGKTTTAAKLARYLRKQNKQPLLVAADMQRPAAVEQLQVLGRQIDVPVFNLPGESPLAICRAAREEAARLGRDVIVYDTAGRLAIDEPLMQELSAIKNAVEPRNILLVVDAMIGQDAVKTAKSFNERLGISGVVLTKLDGDARGGAALSVKEVTGAPVVFVGMGETTDKLEPFRAEGMASRVLGMGDVVGLIQDFEEVVDQKKAEEDARRMMSGKFTLDDFLNQVRMLQKMGSLSDLVEKIPGLGNMVPPGAAANLDDGELVRIEAMIQSMTLSERDDPNALVREPSRVKRIARGSGQPPEAVSELVQKFLFMRQMMGGFGQDLGFLGNIPGMKNLAMAKNLKKAMQGGGFPGFPGMGLPGMGFPGMGMPGGASAPEPMKMRVLSKAEKNARKNQRKRERDARKKGKKR
jgi:signal recognition particle subunit SRP54